MGNARLVLPLTLLLASAAPATMAVGAPPASDDRFLAGVASAVLELQFGLTGVEVVVEDGRLRLDPRQLQGRDPEAVRAALDGLRGLEVTVAQPGPAPMLRLAAAGDALPLPPPVDRAALVTGFLPEDELFESPLADPRSPAISAAVQSYFSGDDLDEVGRVDFGGSLPLYGWRFGDSLWQLGVQGGVFSIFDLNSSSSDLINADYLVAVPLEASYGDFSTRLRFLHQSSHLGDEFLLRNDIERVNLSYEAVDLLLAYDLTEWLRVYGGGSTLIAQRPDDLDPFGAQAGFELKAQEPLLTPVTYPVAGLDLRAFQETDWEPNLSVRGGIELKNGGLGGTRVQLLAEYFTGRSPHGQFYDRTVEFVGVGFRVLF